MFKINLVTLMGCVLALGAAHMPVHAQVPAWEAQQRIDTTAFRSVLQVPAQDIKVPTVFEVPIPNGYVKNQQAVVQSQSGTFMPALYVTNRAEQETLVTISGSEPEVDYTALTDDRLDTTVDFPFRTPDFDVAYMVITADKPITTSELRLTLAPNVALPYTVGIDTTDGESITNTVVASRPMQDSVVRFPETTARQFTITFRIAQPLRLAEISLVQTMESDWTEAVRFLAQPDTIYQVYVDPDRPYGQVSLGGSLSDKGGVRTVQSILNTNVTYRPSDADHDGVPDERDNCVQIANSDQIDIDRNARGDACDDFDRDDVINTKDNCPDDPNWDQQDTDLDGVGDTCDHNEDRFTERNPWVPWVGMGIAGLVLIGLFALTAKGQVGAPVVPTKEDAVEEYTQSI